MAEKIRDLLYLDFEKTASLFSQLEDGLIKEVKSTSESSEDVKKGVKGNFSIISGELAGSSLSKRQVIESKSLHHDLLNKVESALVKRKVVSELNLVEEVPAIEQLRTKSRENPYLLTEGWVSIEDFARVDNFSEMFSKFREMTVWSTLENNEEYQSKKLELAALGHGKSGKQKRERQKLQTELETMEQFVSEATGLNGPDAKLLEMLRFIIKQFLEEVITIRILPFEGLPDFQVVANLKKDCFVDDNIDSLIRAYGRKPNVKLTIFGLVTSIPEKEEANLFSESSKPENFENPSSEAEVLESAFFSISEAVECVDKMLRFTRYPNVTVYPLAIYRSINLGKATE